MEIGQLIAGRYRLQEAVGSGGNGVVWRAVDEELERVVAVKRAVPGDSVQGSDRIRQLRREAKVLAKLNHANVVTLYDVVPDGGDWWMVMEYVPLRSLAERGTVPPEQAARIGVQIASALESAHAIGIVHRDVKPGNVLVTEDGHAKLSDFGSSRITGDEATLEDSGLIPGTPGYLAPEVANGEKPVPASDVFSLGATLFAAVEGRSPFGTGDNPFVLLRRAAAGTVTAPSRAGELTPILTALMAPRPEDRPTAAAAREMLASVAGPAAGLDTGPHPIPFFRRRRVRRAALMSGAVLAVVAVAAVLSLVVFRAHEQDQPSTAGIMPSNSPIVGNPRTADPCGLLDAGAYARYGQADLENDDGNFNRCDVEVQNGQSDVDVKLQLDTTDQADTSGGQTEKIGSLTVVRNPADSGDCDRAVLLPQNYQIDISAQQNGNGSADLCGMADVATNHAVDIVSHGPIPRRTGKIDSASLINQNVCALFSPDTLSLFPGVDALHPKIGFGNWDCQWSSTTSPAYLHVLFDRNPPLDASDGQVEKLGGHQAFVEPDGYGDKTCQVSVVDRTYTDDTGQDTDELLLVVVTGPQPTDQLCQWATAVAGPAAAKLPSP